MGIAKRRARANADAETDAAELLDRIMAAAIAARASDVHFEPTPDGGTLVRYRVAGELRDADEELTESESSRVTARLKVLAEMDPTERKKPQDGKTTIFIEGGCNCKTECEACEPDIVSTAEIHHGATNIVNQSIAECKSDADTVKFSNLFAKSSANANNYRRAVDVRVSTIPARAGESVVVRILDRCGRPEGIEPLGITGENLSRCEELLRARDGLILIAGPTGAGKSTTLYELLREHRRRGASVVTIEDPVEYDIAGVVQTAVSARVGMTFPAGIRAVMRQDPDVIAIGELRDADSALAAYRGALSGRVVMATVHARSAAELPARLRDFGGGSTTAGGNAFPGGGIELLRGVIVQRLLRRRDGGGLIGAFGIVRFPDGDGEPPQMHRRMRRELLAAADERLRESCRDLLRRGIVDEDEAALAVGAIPAQKCEREVECGSEMADERTTPN